MEQKRAFNPIPRGLENAHIILWLIKDTCWAMFYKPGGIFMIFPTISMALYILWRSRNNRSEFFHNLAVCFWIAANSWWMLTEFMKIEHLYKKYAVYLFLMGLATLVVYYGLFYWRDRRDLSPALSPSADAQDRLGEGEVE